MGTSIDGPNDAGWWILAIKWTDIAKAIETTDLSLFFPFLFFFPFSFTIHFKGKQGKLKIEFQYVFVIVIYAETGQMDFVLII